MFTEIKDRIKFHPVFWKCLIKSDGQHLFYASYRKLVGCHDAMSGIVPRVFIFASQPYYPSLGTTGFFLSIPNPRHHPPQLSPFPPLIVWLGLVFASIIYNSVVISPYLNRTKCFYFLYFFQKHHLLWWTFFWLLLVWPDLIFWDQ